jgi:hypothetical protein
MTEEEKEKYLIVGIITCKKFEDIAKSMYDFYKSFNKKINNSNIEESSIEMLIKWLDLKINSFKNENYFKNEMFKFKEYIEEEKEP